MLWADADVATIRSRISYYIKQSDLYPIRRGLYAKDKNYDRFEVATKILSPAYISFETVLASAGIIFQYYNQIFVASYQSRAVACDGQVYTFKRIKPIILTNAVGVEIKENYSIASPERAFLDVIYLYPNYYFDNLSPLNWDKVYEILPMYQNKRMAKMVQRYHKGVKEENSIMNNAIKINKG